MTELIEAFLKEHGIEPRYTTGRSYVFDCPACGGDKKLWVDKNTGQSVCFKGKTEECLSPGSKAHKALSQISGLSLKETAAYLYTERTKIYQDEIKVELEDNKKHNSDPELAAATMPFDAMPIDWPESLEGLSYLQSRGISKEQAVHYQIMYSPARRRVIFPVYSGNVLKGWQGRAIDKENILRMDNFQGPWRAKTLMFEENLVNSNKAIIAEGAVSALKFGVCGGFIATMGKEISRFQVDKMVKYKISEYYLALDRDAYNKLLDIRALILSKSSNNPKVYLIPVPEHRDDFGDCTYEECLEAFKKAELLTGNEIFL